MPPWPYLSNRLIVSIVLVLRCAQRAAAAFALRANIGGGGEHRFHNFVITGASAKIPRQRVADLGLGRFRIAVEQRLRRNQKPGRADAALQARVLEKLVLQNVKHALGGESLDSLDVPAGRLDAEHQTRAYRA